MVYLAGLTVALCLHGSDVGPRPHAGNAALSPAIYSQTAPLGYRGRRTPVLHRLADVTRIVNALSLIIFTASWLCKRRGIVFAQKLMHL